MEYIKQNRLFAGIGENVSIEPRFVPLYANLIRIHDNVTVAADVKFYTHDVTHRIISGTKEFRGWGVFQENLGCIKIMDNCFIGGRSVIIHGVRIGPNAVVGAGSVVVHDIPPDSVAADCPAKVIGSFEDFVKKSQVKKYPDELKLHSQVCGKELADFLWKNFEAKRADAN